MHEPLDAHTAMLLSEALSGHYTLDLDPPPGGGLPVRLRGVDLPAPTACLISLRDGELWILYDLDAPLTLRHVRAALREAALTLGVCLDPREDSGGPQIVDDPDASRPHQARFTLTEEAAV